MAEILEDPLIKKAPPNLFIGSVPFVAQNFSWSLIPGPFPFEAVFEAPKKFENNLRAIINPTFIELKIFVGVRKEPEEQTIRFDNLYIKEIKQISDFQVNFLVSDDRFLLRGQKTYFMFNQTRIKNQRGLFNPPPTESTGEIDVSVLRAPFDTFAKGRYVPPSVDFDKLPFTMSEILRKVLDSLGITAGSSTFLNKGDYIMENVASEGDDAQGSLVRLLAGSRLNLGIRPNGDKYLYSIDQFDQSKVNAVLQTVQQLDKAGPGTLYPAELSRVRPKEITVKFEKLIETWIKFKDSQTEIENFEGDRNENKSEFSFSETITPVTVQQNQVFSCTNVIRIPFVPNNFVGQFNIGEYMPIQQYFGILGIDEELVKKSWWTHLLEKELNKVIGSVITVIEPITYIVAGAIRQHYRQVFMIEPRFLDRMKRWENARCSVTDNFSGYRPPSPLFADATLFPRGRNIEMARGQITNPFAAFVYIVDNEDPRREKTTLGSISIVNHDLGVFRVEYPPTTDTVFSQIVPSAIINPPLVSVNGAIDATLQHSPLADDFTMETIISTVHYWDKNDSFLSTDATNPPFGKFYEYKFSYVNNPNLGVLPASGPNIDFLSNREFARIDIGGQVANGDILRAVAEAEAAKIVNQFKDRIVGLQVIPGIYKDIELDGNIKSITYTLSESEGANTIIDMRDIPFDPQIEQQLSPEARRQLYRQLEKGGP